MSRAQEHPPGDTVPQAPLKNVGRCGRLAMRFITGDVTGAALIMAALALGIGLVTTIFACLDSYLFRGLPFPGGDRMYHVGVIDRKDPRPRLEMTFRDVSRYRESAPDSVEAIIAFEEATSSLRVGDGLPVRCVTYRVAGDLPGFLGTQPMLGRGFTPAEQVPGGPGAVQISHQLWQEMFGGDPAVLGRIVEIDGVARTIVGVWGPEFRFIRDNDLLVSSQNNPAEGGQPDTILCARLRPGASPGQAAAELGAIAARLAREYPETNDDFRAVNLRPLHQAMLGPTTVRRLWLLQAFAVLVLIIGCCNAASLLAARFAARRGEMAVRTALGATRGRLIALIIGECGVFAVAGGAGGTLAAYLGVRLLWNHVAAFAPFWVTPFSIAPATLGFVVVVTIVAGLLAGMGPAVHGSRVQPADVLKEDQRAGGGGFLRRFSASMVVVQVAVAFALLTGAGLLVRAVHSVEDIRLPFDPARILTARVTLRGPAGETAAARTFFDRLERELEEAYPDLGPVAFTSREGMNPVPRVSVSTGGSGRSEDRDVALEVVSPDYFAVLGVTPLRGREFTRLDTPDGMPVAVVNQTLARHLWPGESAVGQRFRNDTDPTWLTVIGVVPDLRQQGFLDFTRDPAGFYRPASQVDEHPASVIARPRGSVTDWGDRVRRAVFRVDANQAPKDVGTMFDSLGGDTAMPRTLAFLFVLFGVAATIVAAIGVYGLTAFSVALRTREFGIRMVFGALRRDIAALATRQGAAQLLPGVIAGALLAFLVAQLLQRAALLGGVRPIDPVTYVTVCALMLTVGALAIARPVHRIMQLEPWEVMRRP